MRLTFVHDGPLFYDTEGNYYEFAYHELYERYSYIASDITFMMRTKPVSGERKFTLVPHSIRVVDVPNFKSPSRYLSNKRIAQGIVREEIQNTDFVILRSQSSIAQLALPYIKEFKKPYIIECVGCTWDSYWNHGLLGKAIAPYMFLKTRNAIKNAGYVYYVTNEFLQKRYPTKGKTVSCSNVVLDPLNESTLSNRLNRIERFNPKKELILGTAAALDTRYKGHEYVIKAIPMLLDKGYNVEYRLAGGYTSSRKDTFLKDLAKKVGVEKRVVFCGSLSASEMPGYYDELDIYIQPSKQEGLPRAVIEAMSRACPAIGTNIAGIPELLPKELLFRKNTSRGIVDKIESLMQYGLDTAAKENFIKASQYERQKLVQKREAFYDQVLTREIQ